MNKLLKSIALKLITFYQKSISPLFGSKCRFIPTCSAYTYEAIEVYGVFKGSLMGIKRISKCHPFNPPMYDPVPSKQDDVIK